MAHEDRARLIHAAKSLAANLTDEMLETLRAEWGNTNVAVLTHWRAEVLREAATALASAAAEGSPHKLDCDEYHRHVAPKCCALDCWCRLEDKR